MPCQRLLTKDGNVDELREKRLKEKIAKRLESFEANSVYKTIAQTNKKAVEKFDRKTSAIND